MPLGVAISIVAGSFMVGAVIAPTGVPSLRTVSQDRVPWASIPYIPGRRRAPSLLEPRRPRVADIGFEELLRAIDWRSVGKVVLAHVFHHTGEPDRIVRQLYRWLALGTRMLVAEFDPDAPAAIGPKPDECIARGTLVGWLERAGFTMVRARAYPEHEQYAFLLKRP
ncbi:MAG TPA: hypothetical protein VIK92_01420 [Thermaerobacter sp.]